ncbi:MAG: nuclear transport factor 2 family protein [Hyphomicrobiaceae bacterium]|nr:nuclear transport factor 2 family protein [Hyphomicrobiaceae bacterium]
MDQDLSLTEVIEANALFYAALGAGDIGAMEALWSARADVSVYHPNWPGIFGREEVMSSWRTIMLIGEPPQVGAEIHSIIRTPLTALVFCVEEIGACRMTASNVFVREAGAWRLTSHHARSLPVAASGAVGIDED